MIERLKSLEKIRYNLALIAREYGKLEYNASMQHYNKEHKSVSQLIFDLKAGNVDAV